jgi:N-acyl-D-amino-acid deacylase
LLDTAIRGGDVVDGSGAPRQRADIGIHDGRIVAIGDVGAAAEEIDASSLVVAPGFVDVHSHFDAQVEHPHFRRHLNYAVAAISLSIV